jgi:hypothetical protein
MADFEGKVVLVTGAGRRGGPGRRPGFCRAGRHPGGERYNPHQPGRDRGGHTRGGRSGKGLYL